MQKTKLAVLAALGLLQTKALITKNGQKYFSKSRSEAEYVSEIQERMSKSNSLNPQTYWFNATIDHYDNNGAGSPTYPMRYLVDRTYFNQENGPIIFYAGNEGDVWTFWDNSGFMTTTLAQQFGALVVFGEHRYFGESMPFGDSSYDRSNLKYLTVEQAMYDYVELIKEIKNTEGLQDRAVIVGGGSYGGMLAAWLRMKFPQWFQGALAASAPILFFDGYVDPFAYDDIATGIFAKADPDCPASMKAGFDLLDQLKSDSTSYAKIAEIFNLCTVPTSAVDIMTLSGTVNGALGTMVMVDYPYPTSFIEPLPAWPVNNACLQASLAKQAHADDPWANLYAMAAAGNAFYNYNNQNPCLDTSSSQDQGLDTNGWNVLYCNEMAMPFASSETTSMFPTSSWNEKENSAYCKAAYGENPQYSWALDYFGGYNPTKDFAKVSNIIFSNGDIDPWHAGGVLVNVNDQSVSLYIEGSAHHLDLREPNEADPATLTHARQVETEWIAKFIDQYQGTNFYEQVTAKTNLSAIIQ